MPYEVSSGVSRWMGTQRRRWQDPNLASVSYPHHQLQAPVQVRRCEDDGRNNAIAMAGNRTHGMSVRNLMWYSGISSAWGTMAIPWARLAQAVKSRNIL